MEISLSASEVLGYASILCWLGAQFPQIIANYRNKSADGLSLPFLFNWLLGDIANFIGCVWTDQQPFQIYLAFYFCIVDFCLFFQYLYYRRFYSTQEEEICDDDVLMAEGGPQWGRHYNTFPVKKPASRQRGTIPLFAIFFFTLRSISYLTSPGLTTSHSSISHPKRDAAVISWMGTIGKSFMDSNNQYLFGRVMAWSCTVLYLTSRMPQIWKNFERKSVEGLSIFMFIFAALGNLTYTTSIFLFENKPADFYDKELPYILGASGTLTFDIIIYMQWWKYRNNRPKRRFSCIVYDIENTDYLPATIRDARSRLLPDQH